MYSNHFEKHHSLIPPFSCSQSLNDADVEGVGYDRAQSQDLLPASWGPGRAVLSTPEADITSFLHADLDVKRLNDVHSFLWIAGQEHNISPLHRSLQKGRRIILTEQTDLHLVWSGPDLYLKPLPRYLSSYSFWRDYLCHDQILYGRALGLLRTYLWLVQNESDFDAATINKLLRCDNWQRWRSFHQSVQAGARPDAHIDKRYTYGELRLGRLNLIYRLNPMLPARTGRGYYNRYSTYGNFFERNFTWTVTVFLYLSIILTAMQVGATTPPLQNNQAWLNALYGFSTFCVLLPLAVVAIAILMFIAMFLSNLAYTLARHD